MFSKTTATTLAATLFCLFLFSNCHKNNDGPDAPSKAEYYLSASLDGKSLLYEVDASGAVEMVNSNEARLNPPSCTYSYGCSLGQASPDNSPYVEILFQDLFSGDCANVDAAFSGLFKPGLFPVGLNPGSVLITYWDGDKKWASYPVGQENAFFEIKTSERIQTPFGVYQKVGGEASCLLFNLAGQSEKLETSNFRCRSANSKCTKQCATSTDTAGEVRCK